MSAIYSDSVLLSEKLDASWYFSGAASIKEVLLDLKFVEVFPFGNFLQLFLLDNDHPLETKSAAAATARLLYFQPSGAAAEKVYSKS